MTDEFQILRIMLAPKFYNYENNTRVKIDGASSNLVCYLHNHDESCTHKDNVCDSCGKILGLNFLWVTNIKRPGSSSKYHYECFDLWKVHVE